MKVTTRVRARLEVTSLRHSSLRRRREISRAADQPRHTRSDRVQYFRARVTASDSFFIGGKSWDVLVPAKGQLTALHPFPRCGEFGMSDLVGSKPAVPFFL